METVQYKCPNCGGGLEFKADKGGFGCEYCLSFFTEEEIKEIFKKNESKKLDENYEEIETQKKDFEEHTNLYSCPNCGAEIISEETTSATFCYYCHNPVILSGRLSGDFKPHKLIPFSVTKESAVDIFKNWCKKKWFLPNDFTTNAQIEKMQGVYVPFWIADTDLKADVQAIGKKINTWRSGDYMFTNTKEFDVVRRASVGMVGIPADGSSKIEDALMEAIEPYDYSKLKDFSMSYLSGFFADKYDVDKAVVFPRIKNRAVDGCDRLIRASMVGYDSLHVTNSQINVMTTDWQYMLLPVWFMNYKHNDKTYSFVINGETGALAGIPPLNVKKLIGFCAGVAAALSLILTICGVLFT
jgi:DNA-directed RNA polymerase subunit RPC12/RpoP